MSDEYPPTEHLSTSQVAAFVDRTLAAKERQHVEAHLADCTQCREEVAEVAALVRQPGRRVSWYILWPVAAAAAILLLVVLPSRVGDPQGPTLRDTGEGVPAITVMGPASGDTVVAEGLGLVWRSFATDARYHVHLSTADGTEVWRLSTTDTSATPPPDVRFVTGGTYLWYVDAFLPDGSSATTGIRRFTVGP
jgi:hypothetical protein